MDLSILDIGLLKSYKASIVDSPKIALAKLQDIEIPVDYFQFYNAVSSVYSSKIEGENIDFDSFFKHKFLNIQFQPDYTKKADDLFATYEYIYENPIDFENLQQAHALLCSNLLPKTHQGKLRKNPMFVLNNEDRIEYIAADSIILEQELSKLFNDIDLLLKSKLDEYECFYYASLIHLVFVKIHPFQDGNGRAARLLEKWFLLKTLGDNASAIQLEKNYFKNLDLYYKNIKSLALSNEALNYSNALNFLLMTINSIF